MKYNLACGPLPLHQQHLTYMGDLSQWILVDLYCKDQNIRNWDATKLEEIENGTADEIYTSHFLEHVPHINVRKVLKLWYQKLKTGGKIFVNVPDLEYALKLIKRYENDQPLDGYYNAFEGEHGIISILYGNQAHEGEYHKSGYTKRYLEQILNETGFKKITISQTFEAHDMGCLIAEAFK